MLERDIVTAIKRYLASLGSDVFFWKEHGSVYGTNGVPDIICCYKEYGPEQYVQILQLIADTWNGAAWSVTGYLLGGVAVFLREYGEEYSRARFIKRLRSATYETLRDEARRQQRGSSDVAHALAITKLYNLTGGRGTVDPRRLTVLD